MARGKYKKKKRKKALIQAAELTPEMMKESPGDTIPGYCFTDKKVCDKIGVISHCCIAYEDPVAKCRPGNSNFGCSFSPTRDNGDKKKTFTVTGRRSKKRRKDAKVASRTSGKTKGGNCVASPIQKYCARYSRARKHPEYAAVMSKLMKGK
jgi:hypothetical protein